MTSLLRMPVAWALGALVAVTAAAAAPRSGPQPGERPLPFTSNAVTGPHRGQQHCYVCELKDEPAVLVFARGMDEATGRLLKNLRDAVRENRNRKLFGWVVFLGGEDIPSEEALEQAAYEFARAAGAAEVPVSVLGDPAGPPGYQIAPEAAVTVIMFRKGRVIANRAYHSDSWRSGVAKGALRDLPKLLGDAG